MHVHWSETDEVREFDPGDGESGGGSPAGSPGGGGGGGGGGAEWSVASREEASAGDVLARMRETLPTHERRFHCLSRVALACSYGPGSRA